jgi:protein-S-isoprenylcysteine O-methyltransferase Ste14
MAWLLSMFALYGSQFDRMSHWDASSISMSIFSYVFGCFLAVCGGLLYLWGLYALGSKRSAGLNFFESNVPTESESLVYRLFVHPQDLGLTMLYAGATLMSTCWSAVFLFCIFAVCMVLFQRVESLPITHPADQCPPLEQPKQMFVALNAFTEAVDDHVTDDQL